MSGDRSLLISVPHAKVLHSLAGHAKFGKSWVSGGFHTVTALHPAGLMLFKPFISAKM
jgi:hypothetical protein